MESMLNDRNFMGRKNPEGLTDRELMEKNFSEYITLKGITGEELREAHLRHFGIEDDGAPSPKVAGILEKLKEMVANGFPENGLRTFIENIEAFEDSVVHFEHYVDGLGVTDGEKEMLKSLVHELRHGTLSIRDRSTGEVLSGTQIRFAKETDAKVRAFALSSTIRRALSDAPNSKYEFMFQGDYGSN